MRLPLCAVLLWLFFEEVQASPVKPSFQSGSKSFDPSKPQQVSNYHAQVPHFQPEHRAKTRHKIKVVRYRLDPWSQIWLKSEVESYQVDPDSHVMRYQVEPQQPAQAIRHQSVPQLQFQPQRQIQPKEATNQGGSQSGSLGVESNQGQPPFQSQKAPYLAEAQNQAQVFSYQTEPQNQEESLQPAPHVLVQSSPYQVEPMTQTKELLYQNEPLTQMVSFQAEPQIQVQGLSYQSQPQSQVVSFHTEPKNQDQGLPYQGDHQMLAQGMSYQEDPQSQMTSCQAEPDLQTQGVIYQVEPQSQVASLQMEPNFQGQDLLYQAEHQMQAAREVSYKVDPPYQTFFHEAESHIRSRTPSIDADPQSQTMTHSMSNSQPHMVSYQTSPQAPSEALPSYQPEECAFFSEDQGFEPPTSA
ncbi:mediator of RNA polymerase II transcription subunit 15 [Oryzias melastigma]|uniref:mediator of RNA polymerase II transcription subunit 15 n=1 Tax=Oryzias melastigma TaxID=30732 RepID=UPI000CF838CC|nr:mediator of RNA polymerase II transcription subunit 15 [Oryzias melastigma]